MLVLNAFIKKYSCRTILQDSQQEAAKPKPAARKAPRVNATRGEGPAAKKARK